MAAGTAIASTALAAYQTVDGISQQKKGQSNLDGYDRQSLGNAYEDTQISTMGTRYLAEESQRANATLIDATRNGGIRGVLGGIPQIVAANNSQNQEGRMYLDKQVQDRTNNIAQDEMRLRQMKEKRDEDNLGAIGSQINSGRQDMWSGMMGVAKSARWGYQNGAFSEDAWKLGGDNPANNQSTLNINASTEKDGVWT